MPTTASNDLELVVQIVGLALCLLGILLCFTVSRVKFGELPASQKVYRVGIATLPAVAFFKVVAFTGFIAAPAGTVFVTNYHVFEGAKSVESCAKCHVMAPTVNDMLDPSSPTLAARHYRNRWIVKDHCYSCHTDYGLASSLRAKLDGYRHLARYTTGTYKQPITYAGTYSNNNCLQCHRNTIVFDAVKSHDTARTQLEGSTMSCLNCHGLAHPAVTEGGG